MEFESCSLPQLCSEETRPNFGFGSSEKDRCACALHFHNLALAGGYGIEGFTLPSRNAQFGLVLTFVRKCCVGAESPQMFKLNNVAKKHCYCFFFLFALEIFDSSLSFLF